MGKYICILIYFREHFKYDFFIRVTYAFKFEEFFWLSTTWLLPILIDLYTRMCKAAHTWSHVVLCRYYACFRRILNACSIYCNVCICRY